MSNDDDAKRIVLARRARFVAAALASASLACGKMATPQPCLEPMPVDAGALDAGSTTTTTTTTPSAEPSAKPVAPPPPQPQVCLKMAPPSRGEENK